MMGSWQTAYRLLKNNRSQFVIATLKQMNVLFPRKLYLKMLYYFSTGSWLNIDKPKLFNEKLQWLKLYNHNPLYTTLVDKYAVKSWVAEKIGTKYVIPTLGLWTKVEEIEFANLPNQFVLKTTNKRKQTV